MELILYSNLRSNFCHLICLRLIRSGAVFFSPKISTLHVCAARSELPSDTSTKKSSILFNKNLWLQKYLFHLKILLKLFLKRSLCQTYIFNFPRKRLFNRIKIVLGSMYILPLYSNLFYTMYSILFLKEEREKHDVYSAERRESFTVYNEEKVLNLTFPNCIY